MRLNIVSKPALAAAALALVAWSASPASAEVEKAKEKDAVVSAAAPKSEAEKTLLRLSQDGYSAMRSIRAARIALFNGKTETVSGLLHSAIASLHAAEKEAPTFTLKVNESVSGKSVEKESESGKVDLIPIDATLALADDYVLTPEKAAHIAKANEHLKKGQHKEALEELRLADVDLNYTRTLMPIKASTKHVEQAIKLLGEHKYYEANLALKAVEDGLTIDTVDVAEPLGAQSGKGAAK
jgi:hypothetical protein